MMQLTLVNCLWPTLDGRETVVKFVRVSMCVPSSDCPWSYLSVWLHNKAAFTLLRSFYSANHIQSAQHTASVHVHSLRRNPQLPILFPLLPEHLLSISVFHSPTALWFMWSFLSLLAQAGLAMLDLSVCIKSQNLALAHASGPVQI